ncbi:hypothetical protein DB42_BS00170 [Neochlamydia sp. EPS4]|nr:hypothetical protein DB42_BS00170 [Neochlamydia sp. EPS4]
MQSYIFNISLSLGRESAFKDPILFLSYIQLLLLCTMHFLNALFFQEKEQSTSVKVKTKYFYYHPYSCLIFYKLKKRSER